MKYRNENCKKVHKICNVSVEQQTAYYSARGIQRIIRREGAGAQFLPLP